MSGRRYVWVVLIVGVCARVGLMVGLPYVERRGVAREKHMVTEPSLGALGVVLENCRRDVGGYPNGREGSTALLSPPGGVVG